MTVWFGNYLFNLFQGAYTGVCSQAHVPSYKNNIDKLKAKGIDSVICVAVNDPYVLNGWAEKLEAKDAVSNYPLIILYRITILADNLKYNEGTECMYPSIVLLSFINVIGLSAFCCQVLLLIWCSQLHKCVPSLYSHPILLRNSLLLTIVLYAVNL
jgi:hypothetical protein